MVNEFWMVCRACNNWRFYCQRMHGLQAI